MEIILIICFITAFIVDHYHNKKIVSSFDEFKDILTKQNPWRDKDISDSIEKIPSNKEKVIRIFSCEEDFMAWEKNPGAKVFIVTHKSRYCDIYLVRHGSLPEESQVIEKLKLEFDYSEDSLDIFEASITDL